MAHRSVSITLWRMSGVPALWFVCIPSVCMALLEPANLDYYFCGLLQIWPLLSNLLHTQKHPLQHPPQLPLRDCAQAGVHPGSWDV